MWGAEWEGKGGDGSKRNSQSFSEGQNGEDRPWRNRLQAGLQQRRNEGETGQRKREQMNAKAKERANKEVGERRNLNGDCRAPGCGKAE